MVQSDFFLLAYSLLSLPQIIKYFRKTNSKIFFLLILQYLKWLATSNKDELLKNLVPVENQKIVQDNIVAKDLVVKLDVKQMEKIPIVIDLTPNTNPDLLVKIQNPIPVTMLNTNDINMQSYKQPIVFDLNQFSKVDLPVRPKKIPKLIEKLSPKYRVEYVAAKRPAVKTVTEKQPILNQAVRGLTSSDHITSMLPERRFLPTQLSPKLQLKTASSGMKAAYKIPLSKPTVSLRPKIPIKRTDFSSNAYAGDGFIATYQLPPPQRTASGGYYTAKKIYAY